MAPRRMSPSKSADLEALAQQNKLTAKGVANITKKLDRIDEASKTGPWTRRTLQLISEQPGVVSTVLARQMKIDRYEYRALLSELTKLGLTYGLTVGYAISPRGRAYLRLAPWATNPPGTG